MALTMGRRCSRPMMVGMKPLRQGSREVSNLVLWGRDGGKPEEIEGAHDLDNHAQDGPAHEDNKHSAQKAAGALWVVDAENMRETRQCQRNRNRATLALCLWKKNANVLRMPMINANPPKKNI